MISIEVSKIQVKIPSKIYEDVILKGDASRNTGQAVERCGIIVGRKDGDVIIVTHLIEDEKPEEQGAFHVLRETAHVHPLLRIIVKDDPTVDYIGEWHTHPNGPSRPSMIDHASMMEMIGNPAFGNVIWGILIVFPRDNDAICYYYAEDLIVKIECIIQSDSKLIYPE